jgi:hypothetical protein
LRDSDDATDKEIVKVTYKVASPPERKLSSGKQSNLQSDEATHGATENAATYLERKL